MLLLFLDTETNGVNPRTDQIIELAGILVDFNTSTFEYTFTSSFESLVSLRQPLDEKITRITGITEEELSTAHPLRSVQEAWGAWLESHAGNDLVGVVGHSIDFDLGFLREEGWYLPEGLVVVDTLDLAKILLPQLAAINLEFLTEKLELGTFFKKDLDNQKMAAHRSYFDSEICIQLFANLVKTLHNNNFSQVFYQYIKNNFLPLPFEFYGEQVGVIKKIEDKNVYDVTENVVKVAFSGEVIESGIYTKIQELHPTVDTLRQVESWLEFSVAKSQALVLAQMYVLVVYKIDYPDWHLRIHGQGEKHFCFALLCLKILESSQQLTHTNSTSFILEKFEKILHQIQALSEHSLNLGKIVLYLEIFLDIYKKEDLPDEQLLKNIQAFLSSYDFFLFALQSFWVYNEFVYEPSEMVGPKESLKIKFRQIVEQIEYLTSLDLPKPNEFCAQLVMLIQSELESFQVKATQHLIFRLVSNDLVFVTTKSVDLVSCLNTLVEQYPGLQVTTYLNISRIRKLCECLDLGSWFEKNQHRFYFYFENLDEHTANNMVKYEQSTPQLYRLIDTIFQSSFESGHPALILTGQNSTLKDFQKIIVDTYDTSQYLVLGESGSLTKVGSKLVRGFKGVVVVKVGDFHYLSKLHGLPDFVEIWIVNYPFWRIPPLVYTKAQQSGDSEGYLKELKDLNVEAIALEVAYKTKKPVRFLRAYL